mgnify:CR=1 FL=1
MLAPIISYGQTKNDVLRSITNEILDIAEKKWNSVPIQPSLDDVDGALKECSKAIRLDPKNSRAYELRAMIRSDAKDYYGAISDYTKLIELDPSAWNYYNRALMKLGVDDHNGSCADFKKASSMENGPWNSMERQKCN